MDRDTLARDLLTLPALVGAPVEAVRGLCFVSPDGLPWSITEVVGSRWVLYSDDVGLEEEPADLHAAGWRVDLDAPATAGVLGRLWLAAMRERGMAIEGDMVPLDGERLARALVEVARAD